MNMQEGGWHLARVPPKERPWHGRTTWKKGVGTWQGSLLRQDPGMGGYKDIHGGRHRLVSLLRNNVQCTHHKHRM
jgi:hypothetical protein